MTTARRPRKPKATPPPVGAEVVATGEITHCCGRHLPNGECVPRCCTDCTQWAGMCRATQSAVELAVLDCYATVHGELVEHVSGVLDQADTPVAS